MNAYRIKLYVRSSLATPLVGDTIFGHTCWGIARTEGKSALQEFLSHCQEDPSYFAVSSAFPHGMLPLPILPLPQIGLESQEPLAQYGKRKKHKKKRYIPAKVLFEGKEPLSANRLDRIREGSEEVHLSRSSYTLHNTINRLIGTTEGPTGLYASMEIPLKDQVLDLYVVSTLPLEQVATYVKNSFRFGFGADASVGKGWIEVRETTTIDFPTQGTHYMALGPFIPSDTERTQMSDFFYELFLRKGKLGAEFVPILNPFKKPILLYREGSTFIMGEHKLVIGTILENIHTDTSIKHSAHAPILAIKMEE